MYANSLTALAICSATHAAACFSPLRPVEGYPLFVGNKCEFRHAGGAEKALTYHGGKAYRLENGLVAQTVVGLGYCNEEYFRGSLIADCESRRATVIFNKQAEYGTSIAAHARPGLPVFLNSDEREDYDAILSSEYVTQHALDEVWAEPDTGEHPDLFCGCKLPNLPKH